MKILIQHNCNISAKNSVGDGALALASKMGFLDIAEKLVGMGCPVNEPHNGGYTALHWACREGKVQTANFLISSGADLETLDKWGFTPFLRAVLNGRLEVMTILIKTHCNTSAKTSAQTADFLISSGASLEALDMVIQLGCTPFLCAVVNGHSNVFKALIQRRCNVSAKTSGRGAMELAVKSGHLDIARELVGMKFSVNKQFKDGSTLLHWACEIGHAQTADFLILSEANVEALDKSGRTPFLCAVFEGHLEVMDVLLQSGCSTSRKCTDGIGALAAASAFGHFDIARRLVEIGCCVNEPEQDGFTSLHWACHSGHADIAEFLISSGANTAVTNKFDRTPLLEAKFNKQDDVVATLERILGIQVTVEEASFDKNNPEVCKPEANEDDVSSEKKDCAAESAFFTISEQGADPSQEIYDEALKRGSVTVNRSRVIVAGQDGAGSRVLSILF
ncbi:putative ankyrin repeat protein RF_0381 isoform X2 [Oscarella lobularis]|uniref:putative ankyrin repeat protein RF_0381 isoform X2 n=1 Tax=Oscarella lobularis TaxID=121494 RepID=UPI003313E3B5